MNGSPRSFAIVPAAGHSRRMGTPKLLLPWGDSTVLAHTLAAWRAATVTRTIVVVRRNDEPTAEVVRQCGAVLVQPTADPPEMKDSIRAALEEVRVREQPTSSDVWLLAPADMPWLAPSVVATLLAAHDPETPRILVPEADGRRGHPVLFPWPLAAEVATLGADEGVNALLDRHGWTPLPVPSPGIHGDLDTPEDYTQRRGV